MVDHVGTTSCAYGVLPGWDLVARMPALGHPTADWARTGESVVPLMRRADPFSYRSYPLTCKDAVEAGMSPSSVPYLVDLRHSSRYFVRKRLLTLAMTSPEVTVHLFRGGDNGP